MSEIILRKYHGVGNDYLIFDPKKNDVVLNERLIRQLCRRNIGVGADGILYGPVMEDKKIKVRIFNPDGSEAEKSGNGIRIFSRYLKDAGYVKERQYYLTTKAGETLVFRVFRHGVRRSGGCPATAHRSSDAGRRNTAPAGKRQGIF